MSNFELISLETRMATDEDKHLPTYDHTKLSAINTCPTWGILRYTHHKKMPGSSRAMALDAGSAAHEAFSAVRLYRNSNAPTQHKGVMQGSMLIDYLARKGVSVSTMYCRTLQHIELIVLTSRLKPWKVETSMTTSQTIDVLYPTSLNP